MIQPRVIEQVCRSSGNNKAMTIIKLATLAIVRVCFLLLFLGLVETPSFAASCPHIASGPVDPDYYRGVRTKWRSLARDSRNSIQPDLSGLSVELWVKELEAVSVNLAELNIDPRRRLSGVPVVPEPAWRQYIDYVVNAGEKPKELLFIQNDVIPNFKYTVEQRDAVIIAFLQKLEDLKQAGKISGDLTFVVHQRMWFDGEGNRGERRRKRGAEEFSNDMSGIINAARERCLDHWLAGVRLGEHAVTDMNVLMPVIEDLAVRVNRRTDNWLKTKFFLVNGGGWGAEYSSFDYDFQGFFRTMSRQTGAFALGYKFMQFNGRKGLGYIKQRMASASCGERLCDVNSAGDWSAYLKGLGLDSLKSVVDQFKRSYPMHANVMFVGDSSDSLQTIFKVGASPEILALREVLPDGEGWDGKLFMSGFIDNEILNSRIARNSGTDVGWALYYVANGQPTLQRKTFELWKDW